MRLKDKYGSAGDTFRIPLADLQIEPDFNVRDNLGDIEEIAASILAGNQIAPLIVRTEGERVFVVDGHRRLAAYKLAAKQDEKYKTARCVSEQAGVSPEGRMISQLSFNNGKPLTQAEELKIVKRMISYDWGESRMLEETGKSLGWLKPRLAALSAGEIVQQAVKDGKIGIGTAAKAAKLPREEQAAVIEQGKRQTRGKTTTPRLMPPLKANGKAPQFRARNMKQLQEMIGLAKTAHKRLCEDTQASPIETARAEGIVLGLEIAARKRELPG